MEIEHVVAVARPAHAGVRIDARRRFDLDHVGAEIRQHAAAGRTRPDPGEVEHAQMFQGARAIRAAHVSKSP